jgi:DNA-binding NarL/FixJ family response regulator
VQDAKNIRSPGIFPHSGVLRTTPQPALCHDPVVARTVVIVDDHPSFRASARAILEASKFEIVAEASDGAAALAAVAEHCPDVVLLDVQLPDMTGFEICDLLDEDSGRVPAIVLTSSRDQADYGDLVEHSCARGFLPKAELSGEALAALVA